MLSIELLKKAREVGATHVSTETNHLSYLRKDGFVYRNGCWRIGFSESEYEKHPVIQPIDFTPLDDYYADKALDIAATGGEESEPPEGWYHDDETGGLKPLGKAAVPAPDMVNHPPHYQTDGVECIDAIRAALGLEGFVSYCRGNAIKYSWRATKKGTTAQDLRKAAWYLERAAKELESNK